MSRRDHARSATWRIFADVAAEQIGFMSSLHQAALNAMRDEALEPVFYQGLADLTPEQQTRLLGRLEQIDENRRVVLREYARRGKI